MNKIVISNEQERIKIEFDFEDIGSAREFFQSEEYITDIVEHLNFYKEQPLYDDNDQMRAYVQTQIEKSNTKTLERMAQLIQEELNKRK